MQAHPLSKTSPATRFEVAKYDGNGKLWKRVLISEGKRPSSLWQFWSLIEFSPDDRSALPKVLFKKKLALSESPAAVQKILDEDPPPSPPLVITPHPLWPHQKDHWEPSDEDLYEKWLQKNAVPTFLNGSGIVVDCADYAMALRWIFAYENGLPAAQTLAGSDVLFGSWQSTTEWDAFPSGADWRHDERFKAALKYLFDSTFTHSLQEDLYPVAINRQNVRAGALYLTLAETSGHARTVLALGPDDRCQAKSCILVIWGNEPASEDGFISDADPYFVTQAQGGFMRFRWPEFVNGNWTLRDPQSMPGYSQEQYGWNSADYFPNLNSNLSLWTNVEDQAEGLAQSFINAIKARQVAVNQGFYLCSIVPCDPHSDLQETYSTPVRDADIANYIQSVLGFMRFHGENSPVSERVTRKLRISIFFPGHSLRYLDLLSNETWSKLGSDPISTFQARWNFSFANVYDQIRILARVLHSNWQDRIDLVMQALDQCFQNGYDGTVICHAQDQKISMLGTARLDQALRLQKKWLMESIRAQPGSVQRQIRSDLSQFNSSISDRTLWNLIMTDADIDRMTSSPTDDYKQRFGQD